MGILGAVFSELKGAFGKTFLLAGLLPTFVLLFGFASLVQGIGEAVNFLLSDPSELAVLASVAVGGGLILFSARGLVLRFFQDLPGTLLRPLRAVRLRRYRTGRRALFRRKEEHLWRLSATRWHAMGFDPPIYLQWWIEPKAPEETVTISRRGRDTLIRAAREGAAEDPSLLAEKDVRRIVQSLADLYAASKHLPSNPQLARERDEWNRLVKSDERYERLLTCSAEWPHREWASDLVRLSQLPEPLGLKPTALGNRFAALNEYALERYGIDTASLWTRLARILTKEERQDVRDSRLTVEALANLTVVSMLFAAGSLLAALLEVWMFGATREVLVSLTHAGTGLVGASLFLAGAYQGVAGLADRIAGLVDLNRVELIEALGYEAPTDVAGELKLFRELRGFFIQANPRDPSRKLKTR